MAKTKLTKEQWSKIGLELTNFYSDVNLTCDGFEVVLRLARINQFKNVINVYINGYFKGEWFTKENINCEEARRFFQICSRSLYSEKYKKSCVKSLGKRRATKMGAFKKYQYRSPSWKNFNSLKRHLIANNESIEWTNEKR